MNSVLTESSINWFHEWENALNISQRSSIVYDIDHVLVFMSRVDCCLICRCWWSERRKVLTEIWPLGHSGPCHGVLVETSNNLPKATVLFQHNSNDSTSRRHCSLYSDAKYIVRYRIQTCGIPLKQFSWLVDLQSRCFYTLSTFEATELQSGKQSLFSTNTRR